MFVFELASLICFKNEKKKKKWKKGIQNISLKLMDQTKKVLACLMGQTKKVLAYLIDQTKKVLAYLMDQTKKVSAY